VVGRPPRRSSLGVDVPLRLPLPCVLVVGCCLWAALGRAETPEDSAPGAKITTERWRFGVILTAAGSAFRNIAGTITVPMDWPEQRVRVVEEDLSRGMKISYQPVEDLGRQMVFRLAHLPDGQQARAIVTYEVRRRDRPAPENTDRFLLPDAKRPESRLRRFLLPSPLIESTAAEIRAAAEEAPAGKEKAWDRVAAIYRFVQNKIQYEDNQNKQVLSAVQALRAGKGDCDEITALFVALCRAAGIPARTVRVPRHCYPEFYLLDEEGVGHWFPCQSAGTPSLGSVPEQRPILQKGDNVLLPSPERHKEKVRYRFFPETVVGFPVTPGGSLQRRPIQEKQE
jgi:hypothetical protein